MPQQIKDKRVDASKVQGEGAFVLIRPLTYGESKAARSLSDVTDEERLEFGERLITTHVTDWNWCDVAGAPLPIPAEDPGVLSVLTLEEINFLTTAVTGNDPNARSG